MARLVPILIVGFALAACGESIGIDATNDSVAGTPAGTQSSTVPATAASTAGDVDGAADVTAPDDSMPTTTDATTATSAATSEQTSPSSTTEPGGSTGEVPGGFLESVMADASSRSGVALPRLTVVRAESVVWADGSLGCPEPGVVYTQALVDGFWVEIDAAGVILDYRLTSDGWFRYCADGAPPSSPTGQDPSASVA